MSANTISVSFPLLLQEFFGQCLTSQRNASPRTVASYPDAFMLLLKFAKEQLKKQPTDLCMSDLAELNQRFWRWLECEYNQRAHRALDGASPQQRFQERSEGLRPLPAGMDVDGLFLLRTLWEVPPACRGRIVDVHYDPFRWNRVELYVEGNKVGGRSAL